MTLVVFYFEIWNDVTITCTGDEIPPKEGAMLISNHPSELDWIIFWPLAAKKGMLGSLKGSMKTALRYLPGLGWAMDCLDFIFLNRDWDKDEQMLTERLQSWVDDKLLIWLFFFPEGTDFTTLKHSRQLQWAADEHKGEGYKNLLIPKTKGFITCVNILRPNLKALYDITISYGDKAKPKFATFFWGNPPRDIHLHIRRWPIDQIPTDQNELKSWLFNCYKEKDDLIEYFKINQKFPSHISFLKDPTERDKGIQQQLRNSRLFCFSWFFLLDYRINDLDVLLLFIYTI